MKKPEDYLEWLWFWLFDISEYWYVELLLKSGNRVYCTFYRPARTCTIYVEPLEIYLQTTTEEKEAIEEEALEMGCELNTTSELRSQGGVP